MNTNYKILGVFLLTLIIVVCISGLANADNNEYTIQIQNVSDTQFRCNTDYCTESFGTTICNLHAPSIYDIITSIQDVPIEIIDIRTPQDYQESHLEGAKNIYYADSDFADQLAYLNKTEPVIVYCRTGMYSESILPIMQEMGFSTILNLEYGIDEWILDGYPVI